MRLIPKKDDAEIELFLAPLETMSKAGDKVILRRVLRKAIELTKGLGTVDFGHVEDIIRLVKEGNPGDRIALPRGIRAVKKYLTLLITSKPPARLGVFGLDCPGSVKVEETGAVISASRIDREEAKARKEDRKCAVLDAQKIRLPLTVRARKEGDFFYPSGLGGRKKLQDFFVDRKIPRDERDSVPVVTTGDGVIVWVAGMRADGRFAASDKTEEFIVLEIKG
jgi:tRNA(Ile)-lysidine synthase